MNALCGMIIEFLWSIMDVVIIVYEMYQIVVNGNTSVSVFVLLGLWLFLLPYNAILAVHYFKEYFEGRK